MPSESEGRRCPNGKPRRQKEIVDRLSASSPAAHRSAPSCKRRSITAVLVKPIQRGQKNDLRLSMTGAEFLAEATELAG
jgi:hypothetical protein